MDYEASHKAESYVIVYVKLKQANYNQYVTFAIYI